MGVVLFAASVDATASSVVDVSDVDIVVEPVLIGEVVALVELAILVVAPLVGDSVSWSEVTVVDCVVEAVTLSELVAVVEG